MIVTDTSGKKVNAERFSLEIVRGWGGNENGEPILILLGHYSYYILDKSSHEIASKRREDVSQLVRRRATEKNIKELLRLKDEYENNQRRINRNIHEYIKSLDFDNDERYADKLIMDVEKEYAFQNGWLFKMENEDI